MILISKHEDLGKSLFDPSEVRTTDAILIHKVITADLPMFDIATEYNGGVAQRKESEFAISFSFLQSETSVFNDDTIQNLLRRGDRNFRYHIVIERSGFTFSGTFKSEDINYAFNFNDSYKASFMVKGVLAEFHEYTKSLNSYFTIASQETSFEEYLQDYHMNFINIDFGGLTYNDRFTDNVVFSRLHYERTGLPGFTDWSAVSRWETFYELSKGVGFDFDFVLRYTPQEIYNATLYGNALTDLYTLKIFFKSDITNFTPITISRVFDHQEFTVPKQQTYVFLGTRYQVPDPAGVITVTRGVLYGDGVVHESDTSDSANRPPNNFADSPYFQLTEPYINWDSLTEDISYPRDQISNIPLRLYSCPVIDAYGQYIRQGSLPYSRFFTSLINGHHLPVQRNAAAQYKRYINSQAKKGKKLKVLLSDVPNIRQWSKILFTDIDGLGEYYVSNLADLNWNEDTIVPTLIQL